MPISTGDLIAAWTRVLLLSQLEPRQSVTILTDPDTNPQTLAAAAIAADSLGAIVNRLEMVPVNGEKSLSRDKSAYVGRTPLTGNRAAMAALKASDIVLDLMLLLFSPEQHEILQGGTKILLAVEPPEDLTRLIPTLEDRDSVQTHAARLGKARSMRILSDAGTDLSCALGEYPLLKEYGFVDEPGRWDHWPSGLLSTWPNEGTAEGRIVLDRGDILLPQKSYVQTPIEMTIKAGYVTNISGGLDAELLNDYMESFADGEAYAVSHVGWGLQPRARWSVLGLYGREATMGMDARVFAGNFLFSLGPNTEAGGTRNTPCHIDIPMRNCTVSLDGEEVIRKGRLVKAGRSA